MSDLLDRRFDEWLDNRTGPDDGISAEEQAVVRLIEQHMRGALAVDIHLDSERAGKSRRLARPAGVAAAVLLLVGVASYVAASYRPRSAVPVSSTTSTTVSTPEIVVDVRPVPPRLANALPALGDATVLHFAYVPTDRSHWAYAEYSSVRFNRIGPAALSHALVLLAIKAHVELTKLSDAVTHILIPVEMNVTGTREHLGTFLSDLLRSPLMSVSSFSQVTVGSGGVSRQSITGWAIPPLTSVRDRRLVITFERTNARVPPAQSGWQPVLQGALPAVCSDRIAAAVLQAWKAPFTRSC